MHEANHESVQNRTVEAFEGYTRLVAQAGRQKERALIKRKTQGSTVCIRRM
jgi:hypothetical protein